jgi:hypothetical protein
MSMSTSLSREASGAAAVLGRVDELRTSPLRHPRPGKKGSQMRLSIQASLRNVWSTRRSACRTAGSAHAGSAGTHARAQPGTRPGGAPGATRADRRDRDCMNETCDRCGPAVRAVYRAGSTGELYLCRHCGNRLELALHARGWTMSPVSRAPA